MKRQITALVLAGMLLLGTAAAAEEQARSLGLDRLEEAAGAYGPGYDIESVDLNEGLKALLDTGSEEVRGVTRKAVRSGTLLLVVVLLCALAEGAYLGTEEQMALRAVPLAGVLAISAVAVTDVHSLIGMGRQALGQIEAFSRVLLPVMAAATAASGFPGGAAARQLATMLFSSLLLSVITKLLLPLAYAYIAVCVAYSALGNTGLRQIAGTLKWLVSGILTVLLTGFIGYLTVSGAVAGTTDAVAVKTAKLAVSGMVPVVGGILSDAAETVLAGAELIKNAVGVFGMLVILSICLVPFLQLGVHYLVYKLTAALASTVADGPVAELINNIGGAFGLILGMTGASAVLLMVSMVSAVALSTP